MKVKKSFEKATFGGGCFWCTEAIFKELKGVAEVVSGYAGGKIENPNYYEVSEGNTGHAESIQISFDPDIINYEKIVEIFFLTHDPTSLNRQGNDIGTQYRSVIFYHNSDQKEKVEVVKNRLQKDVFEKPIMTEIKTFDNFYPAENYHQNYYERNKDQPYCQFVISPKISKLREKWKDLLKKS